MIRASNLSKFYGGKRALGPVSFEINDGETVGFLGLNGAGKTTALRILACDLRPSAGTIEVGGVDVVSQPHEVRKKIGFLPENPPLYADMIVTDYLRFSGELRGMTKAEVKKRLPEVLEIARIVVAGFTRHAAGIASASRHSSACVAAAVRWSRVAWIHRATRRTGHVLRLRQRGLRRRVAVTACGGDHGHQRSEAELTHGCRLRAPAVPVHPGFPAGSGRPGRRTGQKTPSWGTSRTVCRFVASRQLDNAPHAALTSQAIPRLWRDARTE